MIEICIAFIISCLLLVVGIIITISTGTDKRHKQGMVIGVVALVLVSVTGVVGVVEVTYQVDSFFPDLSANITGSANAIYRQPTVIPADNGSMYVAWYSNAGVKVHSGKVDVNNHGALYLAKVDSSGKIIFNKKVFGSMYPNQQYNLDDSKYQDGYLFLAGDITFILDANGNFTDNPYYTTGNWSSIYQLPGGPVLFPWNIPSGEMDIRNNVLTDQNGNISIITEAHYDVPFNTYYNRTYGTGPYCSVINGTGSMVINQKPISTLKRLPNVSISYCMGLDMSGRLTVACAVGPDWRTANATHFALNVYDAGLSPAVNVTVDGLPGSYANERILDLRPVDNGHFRLLVYREMTGDNSAKGADAGISLDLLDLFFGDGNPPSLCATNLATFPYKSEPSGVLNPNGQGVLLLYLSKSELFLRSSDLAGHPMFKDVRLTPTNDKYSWDYARIWG